MSWALSLTTRYENAAQEIDNAAPTPDSDAVEQMEQVAAAKEAAKAIVASGTVVNSDGQDVLVNATGHANSGHQTLVGQYADMVTVAVTQVAKASGNA